MAASFHQIGAMNLLLCVSVLGAVVRNSPPRLVRSTALAVDSSPRSVDVPAAGRRNWKQQRPGVLAASSSASTSSTAPEEIVTVCGKGGMDQTLCFVADTAAHVHTGRGVLLGDATGQRNTHVYSCPGTAGRERDRFRAQNLGHEAPGAFSGPLDLLGLLHGHPPLPVRNSLIGLAGREADALCTFDKLV